MPAATSRRLVALALPPGEEFIAALETAWADGNAVLPVDPLAPPGVAEQLIDAMRLDMPVDDDVALVIPTSGSTGEPKGAQLTRAALDSQARAAHSRIGLEPGDRWLSCLPWQHIGGIQVMLRSRLLDIPLTVHDRFDIDRVAASNATLTSLVPTQLSRLLDAGVDLSHFRVILLGGAAAPPALLACAADAGASVVTTYGLSETSGGCVYDGRPLDSVEIRLGNQGQIQVRGPAVMTGYRLRPDLDAEVFEAGWLVTSDLGEFGDDGRLRVTGRVDDLVITGGENVASSHVAAVLATHPDLLEVVVTGIDDPEWGQRLVAVVVPRRGAAVPTLAELRDWSGRRLAAAARPRGLLVLGELPRLGSGKPDRLAITRLATERSGNAGG
jgi:o-succinylbenzoate---CoA ligase